MVIAQRCKKQGQQSTFVMNSQVVLGEPNEIVLVFGAPTTRERSILFVDEWVQLLETVQTAVVRGCGPHYARGSRRRAAGAGIGLHPVPRSFDAKFDLNDGNELRRRSFLIPLVSPGCWLPFC